MRYRTYNSLNSAASPASPAGFLAQEPFLGACSTPDRSRRIGSPLGIPLSRLAKGAALLACALACVQEASAQLGFLTTGTVSNFSVTATSGATTINYSITGPSTGFISNLNLSVPGTGTALAVSFYALNADIVGFVVNDTAANSTGGGSGTFTMNFTASVLFFDYASLITTTPPWTTSWNVSGLGSISDGQSFSPGSYTFNFVTTHVQSSPEVIGLATFTALPESSPPGFLMAFAGVFLGLRSLRRRRIPHGSQSGDVQTG